jgi:hypothetical protein
MNDRKSWHLMSNLERWRYKLHQVTGEVDAPVNGRADSTDLVCWAFVPRKVAAEMEAARVAVQHQQPTPHISGAEIRVR